MKSPKLSYNIGDVVWIECCCHGRQRGVIIADFTTSRDPLKRYIIAMDDPEYPHEEVRHAILMSPTEDGVIPYTEDVTRFQTRNAVDPRH